MRMVATPYKVLVVVDREFGERLSELEPDVPAWIVGTPANRSVAERLWKDHPREGHLTGISTFKDRGAASAEDLLISELDTIDLHHGSYSANPPYTVLEVFGTPLSDKIKAELCQYGFDEFHSQSVGFFAARPMPSGLSGKKSP